MIDRLYDSEVSESVIRSVASTFSASSETDDVDFAYWDVHVTNAQRFFNTVCIYDGLDPEDRQAFVDEMELPEDRAAGCKDEAALNAMFSMYFELPVIIEQCGEPNAFFSAETGGVTMCSEYEPYTREQLMTLQ